MDYSKTASKEQIDKTIKALKQNGISSELLDSADEAKGKIISLIPKGSEVLDMTSITLEQTGIADLINKSDQYISIKNKLSSMNREEHNLEMQKIGAAPEWTVGSVHAVTQDGKVLVASNTGSQLPAYAYGASHVIWVAGTQKIVKNLEEGMIRIQNYIVPKESVRARKAYGLPEEFNTYVSKLLIFNREVNPERIRIIFVNEVLGF